MRIIVTVLAIVVGFGTEALEIGQVRSANAPAPAAVVPYEAPVLHALFALKTPGGVCPDPVDV